MEEYVISRQEIRQWCAIPMEQLAEETPVVAKSNVRPSVLEKLRAPLPEQHTQKPKQKELEV